MAKRTLPTPGSEAGGRGWRRRVRDPAPYRRAPVGPHGGPLHSPPRAGFRGVEGGVPPGARPTGREIGAQAPSPWRRSARARSRRCRRRRGTCSGVLGAKVRADIGHCGLPRASPPPSRSRPAGRRPDSPIAIPFRSRSTMNTLNRFPPVLWRFPDQTRALRPANSPFARYGPINPRFGQDVAGSEGGGRRRGRRHGDGADSDTRWRAAPAI